MATGKAEKKAGGKKAPASKKAVAARKAAEAVEKTPVAAPGRPLPSRPPASPAKKRAGPTARACPLVLDGELDEADFSPGDCLTCSEFDCRFCEAEGSGPLRSRLFASGDEGGDEGDDGWGGDVDFDGGEEAGEDEAGDEEDPF